MIMHFRAHTSHTISAASLMLLICACALAILPGASSASAAPAQISIGVRVNLAPPALPVYEQPACPGPDYIWTPGYWAWDGNDYYWVPGTWVEAPDPGLFWTPGYWAWEDSAYVFVPGYWGPTVGFYGGIDYGFGYDGRGYVGGRWNGNHFYYNSAVNNVNVRIVHNTYVDRSAVVNNNNRVSFNGGNGGVSARATSQQEAAARARHVGPVAAQTHQAQSARSDQQLHASYNHGAPPVAATSRPGNFSGSNVVPSRNAATTNQPARTENRGSTPASQPRQAAPQTNRQQIEHQPAANRQTAPPNTAPAQRPQTEQRTQPQQRPTEQTPRTQQQRPQARPAPQVQPQSQARPAAEQHAAPAQPQRTQPESHSQPERQAQPQRQAPQQHAAPQRQEHPQPQQQHEQPQSDQRDQH